MSEPSTNTEQTDQTDQTEAEELQYSEMPDLLLPDLEELSSDIEEVSAFDQGQYIALSDLDQFLHNDSMEDLMPAAEMELSQHTFSRYTDSPIVQLPTATTPFSGIVRNIIRGRRRLTQHLETTSIESPASSTHEGFAEPEPNYLLPKLLAEEEDREKATTTNPAIAQFAIDLMHSTFQAKK